MSNKWNNFFNALIDVCEEYNKMKEKADAKKMEVEYFSDIFAEPVYDKSAVVETMAKFGWSRFDMKMLVKSVNTPEQAKVAMELIKRGYSSFDIRDIIASME